MPFCANNNNREALKFIFAYNMRMAVMKLKKPNNLRASWWRK